MKTMHKVLTGIGVAVSIPAIKTMRAREREKHKLR